MQALHVLNHKLGVSGSCVDPLLMCLVHLSHNS